MINVNFVNIDISKLIGRLLPAWARGRKTSALLQAILSPLKTIHDAFKAWALEKYIFAHVTSQGPSIAWYLKYKLGSHFKVPSDEFGFVFGLNQVVSCFGSGVWRNNLYWRNDHRWDVNISEGHTDFEFENAATIVIYAPKINNTPQYSENDYKRDIMLIFSQFNISFKKILIIINP